MPSAMPVTTVYATPATTGLPRLITNPNTPAAPPIKLFLIWLFVQLGLFSGNGLSEISGC